MHAGKANAENYIKKNSNETNELLYPRNAQNYYCHWYCLLALFWQAQLDNISDSFEAFFGVL